MISMNCKVAPVEDNLALNRTPAANKNKKKKKVKVSLLLLSSNLSDLYHQFREDLLEVTVLLILYHLSEWGILEHVFYIKASCSDIPFALS